MVYGNYIYHTENIVVYSYGGHPSDLSGEIVFNIDGRGFEIVKEPEVEVVYLRSIRYLYSKYKADFLRREFKQKISFES